MLVPAPVLHFERIRHATGRSTASIGHRPRRDGVICVPERDIRPSFAANASTNRSGGADSGYHISYGPSSVKVAGPTPKELGGAVLGEMASPPRAHSRIVEISARDHKVRPRLDSHHEGVTLAAK